MRLLDTIPANTFSSRALILVLIVYAYGANM